VAQDLRDAGYTNAFALTGGWNVLMRARYPTEPK